MLFEWNPSKAASNFRKHGVSFEEAETVFGDPRSNDIYDEDHSDHEGRFILVGKSERGRVLVVSYTERPERRRLISARVATSHERRDYKNV